MQGVDNALLDDLGGRAARVRRRQIDHDFFADPHITQDAEIGNRQYRDFGVCNLRQPFQYLLRIKGNGYQLAPGCVRCRYCISAIM